MCVNLVIYQETLWTVSLRIRALWDVRRCWASGSWQFKELYCLHCQGSSGQQEFETTGTPH